MSQVDSSKECDDFAQLGQGNRDWTLFLVSALGLFLELMLIRWIGTEIRIFAYLQNTVLVVCFLGLGMGCLTCRKPVVLRDLLWPLGLLLLLLAVPFTRHGMGQITEMLSLLSDMVIWSQGIKLRSVPSLIPVTVGLGLTFMLMVLVWDMFVPLGRWVGRLLDDHPKTLWAYSVNVAGSLVGIWLFVLLSAWKQPPVMWVAVLAGILAVLIVRRRPLRAARLDLGLLAGLVLLAWFAGMERNALEVWWSPYQKLVLHKVDPKLAVHEGIGQYLVTVNNVGYQEMIDLSEKHVAADPDRFPPDMRGMSQYDMPYLLHDAPKTALIVGAGSGNDAAGALRQGVERVTAVDIDPVIIDLGRRYHPEHPYDSPRVRIVNDDARSFFATSHDKFDVISFGLLDSHTTTSLTNARLDHYVYTRESLQQTRSLLAEGGVVVLSFFVEHQFIADRMAPRTLREVFGAEPICIPVPCSAYGRGGVMFVAGDLARVRKCLEGRPQLASLVKEWQAQRPIVLTGTTPVATDDWPYIYLASRRVPTLYLLLAGMLLLLLVRCARRLQLTSLLTDWDQTHWHFFFLGAAFLLLEVQNISKASVVLGNTWIVNAVIISGILAMVLISNLLVSRRLALPTQLAYLGLFLICIALGTFDVARFGFLPAATKAVLVGGVTSLPMLFSGMIFARSFTSVTRKDQALGANLFGALFGGLLQSITFVVGIRALLLIVAGLYFAAYLTRPRTSGQTQPKPHTHRRTESVVEKNTASTF